MLTKRANILFDPESWQKLTKRAKREKTSVGKLVRKAVEKAYHEDKKLEQRKQAIDEIFRIRKVSKKPIDYKALINYGRKY